MTITQLKATPKKGTISIIAPPYKNSSAYNARRLRRQIPSQKIPCSR